jgi:hypothetical protein
MNWSSNFLFQNWKIMVYCFILYGAFIFIWVIFKVCLYRAEDKMKVVNSLLKTIYDLVFNQVIKTWEVQ